MAAITSRFTSLEDLTVLSIDGASVLAIFRNASLEVSADEIDVTAARDEWKKREEGTKDWRVSCSGLVLTSPKYLDSIISGGTILVSVAGTGFDFLGTGLMTGSTLTLDNPMTEECTVVSAGNAPTVTIGS